MKAIIIITGGKGSINVLKNAINDKNCIDWHQKDYQCRMFFSSIRDAKESIRNAYKQLKAEEPDYTGIIKANDNSFLEYDTGRASISVIQVDDFKLSKYLQKTYNN